MKNEPGKIIVLNGVSSSGKTTLSKELQDQSDSLLFRISVDDFLNMIPSKSLCLETCMLGIDEMFDTIRSLSEKGFSVVADVVILESMGVWDILQSKLKNLPVLLVRVNCPIEELRQREIHRGDRAIGQGEAQLSDLFPRQSYDVEVDTHNFSAKECAAKILAELHRAKPVG